MELCKNYRLLCNGFEPVGTLRFCDSNSLALSANGEELNGERKACWLVEGAEKLLRIAWQLLGVLLKKMRRASRRTRRKSFISGDSRASMDTCGKGGSISIETELLGQVQWRKNTWDPRISCANAISDNSYLQYKQFLLEDKSTADWPIGTNWGTRPLPAIDLSVCVILKWFFIAKLTGIFMP
ncbi:hypothetical protein DKX38_021495 [Salix brachista]|uniref:Uncharacterized protein n=1 Tax=Salix brachista TaxID=2182728 RepID=A0A5N5K7Y6_9ROSI|nr:hypothetical protein DKX38_021495 [Salix brachista]